MKCPNCKNDLVQVNGRYICSDCGREVPESEVNIGDWGQGSSSDKVIPEPVSDTINDGEMPVDMADDYIDQSVEPPTNVNNDPLSDSAQSNLSARISEQGPAAEVEASNFDQNIPEEGFYTADNPSLDVDLESLKSKLAEPAKNEVVLEKTSDQAPINIVDNADDLAPINDPGITLPASNSQIGLDGELYEDPIYDMPDTEVKIKKIAEKEEKSQKNPNKKLVIGLIIGGVVISFGLILGGIYGYSKLTSASNVVSKKVKVVDNSINCDNSDNKESCISENFSKCTVNTTWTDDYQENDALIETLGYQINGVADDSCEVKVTNNKSTDNSEAIGKNMVCSLDNSLTIDEAKNKMNSEICSGDLANILFADN